MDDKTKKPEIDVSAFLDEHGMLMGDKLKAYEESLERENEKNEK